MNLTLLFLETMFQLDTDIDNIDRKYICPFMNTISLIHQIYFLPPKNFLRKLFQGSSNISVCILENSGQKFNNILKK